MQHQGVKYFGGFPILGLTLHSKLVSWRTVDHDEGLVELKKEVRDWLNHSLPKTIVTEDFNTYYVRITFETEEDFVLFKTFWL